MERLRVLIASDKTKTGIRERISDGISQEGDFEVIKLSRVKRSRIWGEIKPQDPDIILVAVSLDNPEEIKELGGFVRTVRKHLPGTKVIIQGPQIEASNVEDIGANGWLDEKLAYELLGQRLKEIIKN